MNTISVLYLSIIGLLLISPLGCKDTNLNLNHEQQTLTLTPIEERKVNQDNSFSIDLFRTALESASPNDNVLLSPISASIALAMLNNGAIGQTKDSINKALVFDGFTEEQINAYYKKIIQILPNLDPQTKLEIANSIWYHQGFDVSSSFLKANENFYHAKIAALDFAAPDSPNIINDWVSESTQGKIPTIVDQISPDMVMYLINAIYFKGSWQEKFDASKTSEMPFLRNDGSVLNTDFMNISKDFNIIDNDKLQGIELPYGDGQFSMFVLLPSKEQSANDFAKGLKDSDELGEIYSEFVKAETNLFFPKFKFNYQNKLNDELSKLGMGIAFTEKADFTGISEKSLLVDEVKQKAFIEVNEEGTEAAAVTSVGVRVTSMPMIHTLKFDRPFVFFIRENNCGLILFTGIINDPSKEENGH
ncbi:serpin family protein [Albibacterium bauzanense]|uniref:Serpin B n=1 Tax=Albibacterium bauzanense TaxID=653929 RepID=A0A4R1LW63_9SPHI|nr:serpin family protein [Albibacterium bauzanense]TCK83355.1 serpin B [Albibacterium bauzanense]